MAVRAPFRFARIPRHVHIPAWAGLVSHDVPFKDGLSGTAIVEVEAKTPLLVGGQRRKATQQAAGEVYPFRLPDGRWAMPPSTVQGMARSYLELVTFARLGQWVDDRRFGFRDLSGSTTGTQHYGRRLSKNVSRVIISHTSTGWLVKTPSGPEIFPCEAARIHYDDLIAFRGTLGGTPRPTLANDLRSAADGEKRLQWFLEGVSAGVAALTGNFHIDDGEYDYPHPHPNRRRPFDFIRYRRAFVTAPPTPHPVTNSARTGTLVLTGKPNHGLGASMKKRDFVFFDRAATSIPVAPETWENFRHVHEAECSENKEDWNPNWRYWHAEYDAGRPMPVFYFGTATSVEDIGTAFAPKIAHRLRTYEMLGHSSKDHFPDVGRPLDLDMAHLVFGAVADETTEENPGLRRRAAFGLGLQPIDDARADAIAPTNPTVLATPKPADPRLYVEQVSDESGQARQGEPLATYSPDNQKNSPNHKKEPRLSGSKIWPATGCSHFPNNPAVQQELEVGLQVQTKLHTLPACTRFEVPLTFHNLRPMELGALLWVLSFGEGAAFGTGEIARRHRLGMGKPLHLGEVTIRVRNLKVRPNLDGAATKDASGYVGTFIEYMKGEYSNWDQTHQVKAVLKASLPAENEGGTYDYMRLGTNQDTADTYLGERKSNRVLPPYTPDGRDPKPNPSRGRGGDGPKGGGAGGAGSSSVGTGGGTSLDKGTRVTLVRGGRKATINRRDRREGYWQMTLDNGMNQTLSEDDFTVD